MLKGAEWVHMPFKDLYGDMLRNAKQNGKVVVLEESYTLDDINRLALEEADAIRGFRFEEGSIEGYFLTLCFLNGQIIRVKTFDEDFFSKVYVHLTKSFLKEAVVA